MTPQQFIKEYVGKTVGYPKGSYIGQCLSLAKWYIKDCFNISPPASGSNSAFSYWSNFPSPLGTKFKKVEYKSGMTIPAWCIPIWNTKVGDGYGHIAVRTNKKSTTSNFESLDQNWNTKVATLVSHTYTNLQGWLQPLDLQEDTGSIIEDVITNQTKIPQVLDENGNAMEVQAIVSSMKAKNEEILSLKLTVQALNDRITILEQETSQNTSGESTDDATQDTSTTPSFLAELKTWIKSLFS